MRILEQGNGFKVWWENRTTFGAWFKDEGKPGVFGYGTTKKEAVDRAKHRLNLQRTYGVRFY